jgi:DNA-directed RNA polymerase II subunit RPB7
MEFQSGDMPNYTTSDGSVCIIYNNFSLEKEESKLFFWGSLSRVFFYVFDIDHFFFLQVKIQKDSEVRLKIIGTRVDATEIVSPYILLCFCQCC